jgi:hypothetical protein
VIDGTQRTYYNYYLFLSQVEDAEEKSRKTNSGDSTAKASNSAGKVDGGSATPRKNVDGKADANVSESASKESAGRTSSPGNSRKSSRRGGKDLESTYSANWLLH